MSKILYNPVVRKIIVNKPDGSVVEETKDSADVVDYPISEAMLDSFGQPMWDEASGTYRTTGQTLEFSLLKGQAGEFPDYVGDILLDRYEFLEDKTGKVGKVTKASMVDPRKKPEPDELPEETDPDNEPLLVPEEESALVGQSVEKVAMTEKGYVCPNCGVEQKLKHRMAIHMATKHPQLLGLD